MAYGPDLPAAGARTAAGAVGRHLFFGRAGRLPGPGSRAARRPALRPGGLAGGRRRALVQGRRGQRRRQARGAAVRPAQRGERLVQAVRLRRRAAGRQLQLPPARLRLPGGQGGAVQGHTAAGAGWWSG